MPKRSAQKSKTPVADFQWPPDYVSLYQFRQKQLLKLRNSESLRYGAVEYYRRNYIDFINHWIDTYDPRNTGEGMMTRMPLILFPKQEELVVFLQAMMEGQEDGLIEKCRDMGATWVCVGFSVTEWLFGKGSAIGWGSRKADLVDRIGDPDSIFEKIRMVIRGLPEFFLPPGFDEETHMSYMRIINPATGATITGEAGNNIGRGGRKSIYFKDESAHYEKPEMVEAALGDNTRVQIDISSVNGIGNVFHRRRENGTEWYGGPAHKNTTNVFIMDWSDHPAKDQDWYDRRKKKAEDDGLLHKFKQEIDRDYSASVKGIIIKPEWVKAAVDAHLKLGIKPTGKRIMGLDVADEGMDLHAYARAKGILIEDADCWGDGDVGAATRQALHENNGRGSIEVQYDCIGVGAGVKAEANRLKADPNLKKITKRFSFTPWRASNPPLFPAENVIPDDEDTPTNEDFFQNIRSQAWWNIARMFERTYKAVTFGEVYDPDTMISLSSEIKGLDRLKKELSQAVMKQSPSTLKLVVDKTPEGTRSPNLADSVIMAKWPVVDSYYTLDNI